MLETTPRIRAAGAIALSLFSTILLTTSAPAADVTPPPDPVAVPEPDARDAAAPRMRLPRRVVRVASAGARFVRVPVVLSEAARLDARVFGSGGRSRSIDMRRAGRSTLALRLRRSSSLVRAFDHHGAARLAVRLAATDAAGNRGRRVARITVLPPKGYVPSHRLTSPLPGVAVSSHFGHRGGRPHHGIDLGAPTGTPIRAAGPGRVRRVGWESGYGKVTIVDHGRFDSMYAHQSRILVRAGQRVRRGQLIGRVGTTGRSFGAHLHFEVHVDGRPRNPLHYLR